MPKKFKPNKSRSSIPNRSRLFVVEDHKTNNAEGRIRQNISDLNKLLAEIFLFLSVTTALSLSLIESPRARQRSLDVSCGMAIGFLLSYACVRAYFVYTLRREQAAQAEKKDNALRK
jgi:hypothetical protein